MTNDAGAADGFDMLALYGKAAESAADDGGCRAFALHNETGEGTITIYRVLPGIRVVYNDLHMGYCHKKQESTAHVIEINHCREGRYECSIAHQTCCYLAPGDLALGALDQPFTDSAFPTRHYHGISIYIELERLPPALYDMMTLLSIDMAHISALLCNENRFFIMRANESIAHIFSELYSIRETRKPGYLKIKVLELLLFLSDLSGADSFRRTEYLNRAHVQKIKRLHDFILADLQRHYTIGELSARFQLSPTALKKDFARVYGAPVYAYQRAYRLQSAQKRLRCTDDSIAQIAAAVGYENPNKFASAFKQVYGVSPTAFRNDVRLDR